MVAGPRRAIFFDVENGSRAQHVAVILQRLAIDHVGARTEFVADRQLARRE
jgi:hypothetical protein